MDEVGSDLNMMNDGHLGGMKFITRRGNNAVINSTKKSKRFTVLGLTALTGDPLMCVVIFEGKERNPLLESGIDVFHPLSQQFEGDITDSNMDFFESNYGKGKLFPGGPVCDFEGKKVPTMIRYSEKGSITGEILTDILRTLDHFEIFKVYRENGATPFLLVDGHQSRFSLSFLKYITDEENPWKVSIGVPYGTALWQVGDSYQQNGRFKISLNKQKKDLIEYRIDNFTSELELLPTDIIPMIGKAWDTSFADVEGNKAAIAERGWFPLNKNLLLNPRLRGTMTKDDAEVEDELDLMTSVTKHALFQDNKRNEELNGSYLNFNNGFAASRIDRIIAHEDIERARARNHIKKQQGISSIHLIKQMKRLSSAGELVRVANTHQIGMDILTELNVRKAETEKLQQEKYQKKIDTQRKQIGDLVKLRALKPKECDWNSSNLKTAIKTVKTPEDGKMPTNKKDLISMWNKLKHRDVGIFVDVPETSTNDETDIVSQQV